MNPAWSSAYVADVTCLPGYFRTQAPSHLGLACLLGGVASPVAAFRDEFRYLELGCGQGFGALALAAGNPGWRATGVDFNPAHIAAARALAAEAELENVAFLEADLATLAVDEAVHAVPEADMVSLHGVWSWVSDASERASCACCGPGCGLEGPFTSAITHCRPGKARSVCSAWCGRRDSASGAATATARFSRAYKPRVSWRRPAHSTCATVQSSRACWKVPPGRRHSTWPTSI